MTVKVIELLPGSVVVFPNQPTKEMTALMKERSETKPWSTLFLSGTAVTVLQPSPETAAELRTKQQHAQHLVERSGPIGVIAADVCLDYVKVLSGGDPEEIAEALQRLKLAASQYEAAKFPKPKLTDFQDPVTKEIDYAAAHFAFQTHKYPNVKQKSVGKTHLKMETVEEPEEEITQQYDPLTGMFQADEGAK